MLRDNQRMFQLSLDEKIYITIVSEDPKEYITFISSGNVFLYYNNQTYQIDGESTVNIFFIILKKLLKKSLFGNLILDDSLEHNVGYVSNERMNNHDASYTYYTDINNDTYWVGMRYALSLYDEYAAWIYNNEDYNIIFEVTPEYPFVRIDEENREEVAQYKKWLESYQPIFKIIISPEIAHQWILQAEEMITFIINNSDRLRIKD